MPKTTQHNAAHNYSVGQKVRMLKSVGDAPDGDSPGGVFAYKGEVLVIRRIEPESKWWTIHVSHEHITDKSFGVNYQEIEVING